MSHLFLCLSKHAFYLTNKRCQNSILANFTRKKKPELRHTEKEDFPFKRLDIIREGDIVHSV
jgi:hypothetical protein